LRQKPRNQRALFRPRPGQRLIEPLDLRRRQPRRQFLAPVRDEQQTLAPVLLAGPLQ
jgi:hypothetical protein